METNNSILTKIKNSIMSFLKDLFCPEPEPEKLYESQTPVWDASLDYVMKDIPYDDPVERADYAIKMKEKVEKYIDAGVCIMCGGKLTMELFFDDLEADPIDVFYYSCEPCKIRYRQSLYKNWFCTTKTPPPKEDVMTC